MMNQFVRTATAALVGLTVFASAAAADKQPIRIGVIFDYTGPFAGGGSKAAAIGTRIAIDLVNEAGGVEGHMIEAIHADAQSKADVAINEATRLLDQENVDLIMGVYSSGHCVPMAQKVDAQKRFMWANVCISSAVFKGRNLKYVFRAQVHSDQFGWASCTFLNEVAKEKLGMEPGDLKVAIIHEDGPYGSGVAAGNEANCTEYGMEVVLKEGYSAKAPDLSSLVTKLRRARGGCHPAHRVQSRHHPLSAAVERAGPQVAHANRARSRLRPDRQAPGHVRGGRELSLQRRPGRGPAPRPGHPRSRAR